MTKTVKGKEISKMNATKHWLTSNAMISKEERVIFDNAKQELINFLNPHWLIEEMLVENIAFYFVKLQRTINIEAMQVVLQWMQSKIDYKTSITPDAKIDDFELFEFWKEIDNPERNKLLKEVKELNEKMVKIQAWIVTIELIENLTKIQRYHTAIENRLYKAIKQFYEVKKI